MSERETKWLNLMFNFNGIKYVWKQSLLLIDTSRIIILWLFDTIRFIVQALLSHNSMNILFDLWNSKMVLGSWSKGISDRTAGCIVFFTSINDLEEGILKYCTVLERIEDNQMMSPRVMEYMENFQYCSHFLAAVHLTRQKARCMRLMNSTPTDNRRSYKN